MKRGFSLLELLVVTAIIGVLVAMLLPAIQRAREAAKRSQCESNLHQIGVAVHAFHDANKRFPRDDRGPYAKTVPPVMDGVAGSDGKTIPTAIFEDLVPFVEGSNMSATASPTLLCPSRRDSSAGPRADYATAWDPHAFTGGPFELVTWNKPDLVDGWSPWRNVYSIMSAIYKKETKLETVTNRDGTSNTALLAHKGIQPCEYAGTGRNDDPIFYTSPWSTKRYPGYFGRDVNGDLLDLGTQASITKVFTSPHSVMPVLRADGSVGMHGLGIDLNIGFYFGYNDGQRIDFADFMPAGPLARVVPVQTPTPPPFPTNPKPVEPPGGSGGFGSPDF